MRPIPVSLLIHDAVYHQNAIEDRWGKPTTGETVVLTRVRVEPAASIKRSRDNVEVQLKSLLFYDCRNSRPRNIAFTEEKTMTFQGKLYKIVAVEPIYDNKRLHHWEVGLA